MAAGLLDAAISSGANLLVGLFAARELAPVPLGVFALLYGGIFVATVAPATALFTPLEVLLVTHTPQRQLASLARNLALSAPVSATASALVIGTVALATAAAAPAAAMLATAAVAAFASPLQDHARRLLHQAGRSAAAAAVSALNLVVIAGLLGAGLVGAIGAPTTPFAALAAGNVVSLVAAIVISRRLAGGGALAVGLGLRPLLAAGSWLLLGGIGLSLGSLGAGLLLNGLGRTSDVGLAEAARVLSQPLAVVALGLTAVLRPAMMRATVDGRAGEARQLRRRLHSWLVGSGVALILTVGVHWAFNPLSSLFPVAYARSGLVAAWVAAGLVNYLTLSAQWQLTALGRQRALCRASIATAVVQLGAVAATARWAGPFSLPLGSATGGLTLLLTTIRAAPETQFGASRAGRRPRGGLGRSTTLDREVIPPID